MPKGHTDIICYFMYMHIFPYVLLFFFFLTHTSLSIIRFWAWLVFHLSVLNSTLFVCLFLKFRFKFSCFLKKDILFYFILFVISWRLITLQYCSGFCHTLTWFSHGFTCVPHPHPPSHLPLHPIPLGLPSAPGPSTCLMHPTWAGHLFHPR